MKIGGNRNNKQDVLKPKFKKDIKAETKFAAESSSDKKLDALLSLYNNTQSEIQFRQKRGDDAVIPVYTLLIATLGVQALDKIFDINFITLVLAFAIPIISLTGVQRGNQEHKIRAAAQGYASFLENQINACLKASVALWNLAYIERYIASMKIAKHRGLKTSQFLTIIGTLSPILLAIFIAVRTVRNMLENGVALLWGAPHALYIVYGVFFIYFVTMMVIIVRECLSFVKNETVRKTSPYFPIDEEIVFPARLIKNQTSQDTHSSSEA